ncbi:MAG TPA: SDR family oxidoreductase, partial [Thermoleophilaceae bacterium]|nr:SDR family oxidoreductase [Thermoleophilaceae bacterium]
MPAALVAGGTGALGGAVVSELVGSGWAVTVVGRHAGGEEGIASVKADLLYPAAARMAVEGVEDLRAVVNLVGGFASGPKVEGVDLAEFERMLRLNLVPAFNLARAAMPRLAAAQGGGFVCVSARAAVRPFPGAAGDITAKAGLLALVQALDAEYGAAGVRSNAV